MRGTAVIAVTLASLLMLALSLSNGLATVILPSRIESFFRADWFLHYSEKAHNAILWRCNDGVIDDKYCNVLLPPLRFGIRGGSYFVGLDIDKYLQSKAKDLSYLDRSNIPINELPILRIYMTDGAIGKLRNKRNEVLSLRTPLLTTSDDDWVSARIIADNGGAKKKVNALIRLKGDWVGGVGGHLTDVRKLSMRIKISKNQQLFGIRKFSVQIPSVRGNDGEALMLDVMRYMNVLAPRYFFVDVRINDMLVGIMALEEHFSKELVEAQSRRWGSIVAIDEDLLWQQTFINLNFGKLLHLSNLAIHDYPVKIFRPGKFKPKTTESQHGAKAVSLLRDYMDRKVPASQTFDLNLMSRWWIINVLWGGNHGLTWNNQRFYFNPISERLEPIPFDNNPSLEVLETLGSGFALVSVVNNPLFRELTKKNIEEISYTLNSNKFQNWFISRQTDYAKLLSIDNIQASSVSLAVLKENLERLPFLVNKLFSESPANDEPINSSQRLLLNINESTKTPGIVPLKASLEDFDAPIIRDLFEKGTRPLYSHLRPFWFWSPEGTDVELKNLTSHPIVVHSIFFKKHPALSFVLTETTIPVYQEGSTEHIFKLPIDLSGFDLSDQMRVSYSYQGERFTRPIFLQFRNHDSSYASQAVTKSWFNNNGVLLDHVAKTIVFPPGHYSLTTSLQTDRAWAVKLLPGVVLEFKQGARLKVNGPIHALGTKESPVRFMIESNPTQDLIGSWGGLLVAEANRKSILRHSHVTGAATEGFSQRQDARGLTGCITFYKSNVQLDHSIFSSLQCEDGLNIISSDFTLDHVEFVGCNADAFDSDFSDGIVRNSVFRNIGNDGIDLSGSRVEITLSSFSEIRDKAISVGEGSYLAASELIVDGTGTGVVSKDKSVVNIRNSDFRNVGNALMAYVKKEEWGAAEIHCENCLFKNVEEIAVEQYASRITVDSKEVSPTPFSRKQLQIAGYTQ